MEERPRPSGLSQAGYLYAFLPDASLWEKPFAEWSKDGLWDRPQNLSLLWLIEERRVIGLRGCRSIGEVRKGGVPYAKLIPTPLQKGEEADRP
jgi:hypothetical protein